MQVSFSCTCRYFCPSCHAKRLALWTQWLDTTLLAPVPHRQVVLTIPKRLRAYGVYRRRLLGEIARVAARTVMSWYPLRDTVVPFLGDRATLLLAHAISAETDCLICSTFFRRSLIDRGEVPEDLQLTEWEAALVEFGRRLANPPHAVPDALYDRVTAGLRDEEIVALVAFGSIMLATNVFNNALAVPLDDYLSAYIRTATDVRVV